MSGTATDYKVNYLIGNDPKKWQIDITTSKEVIYRDLYPHIDLKVYGLEKQIEYDWIIHPGGDPSRIRFAYQDMKETSLTVDGDLKVKGRFGEMLHKRPVCSQPGLAAKGNSDGVVAHFLFLGENDLGFAVGKYNHDYDLVIDPLVLVYSTYLGGTSGDNGYGIALDSSGCVYLTGYTHSSNFPTLNPYMTNPDTFQDVFVTKLNSAGNGLVYSTYLGGTSNDYGYGIALDSSGCAYVTGYTSSSDFPTLNPYMTDPGDSLGDVFVTKLNSAGNDLVYSTYLGAESYDYGIGIAVDSSGCAYVTGYTMSAYFPTKNPIMTDPADNDEDAFVTKMNSTGDNLVYSTYLGGDSFDVGSAIAVDSSGCAYVTGYTGSTDFPVAHWIMTDQGDSNSDVFITKLNSAGDGLEYSTYLSGNNWDEGSGIAVDSSSCAYVTGLTFSTDFPTRNPYMTDPGDSKEDVFVTKLSIYGGMVYSTYLGGSGSDYGYGIAVDSSGCAYVTGSTESTDFPMRNPYQILPGGSFDVCVTKLNSAGNDLVYSTYLGGASDDEGRGIAFDSSNCVYVTGSTSSFNFPTLNPYMTDPFDFSWDAFISKLIYTSITVTSPNGGESWMATTSHDITWTSTGTIANVNIDYSTNSGGNWTSVAAGTANDGSYTWTVPNTPSTTCLVRVSDADGDPSDKSDAVFSIIAYVAETVSAPNTPTGPATGDSSAQAMIIPPAARLRTGAIRCSTSSTGTTAATRAGWP